MFPPRLRLPACCPAMHQPCARCTLPAPGQRWAQEGSGGLGFFPQCGPFLTSACSSRAVRGKEESSAAPCAHTHTHTCDLHRLQQPFPMGSWCCPGWGEPRGNRGPPALQIHPEWFLPVRRLHPTTATSWGSRSWRTGGWRPAAGRWSHTPSSRTR